MAILHIFYKKLISVVPFAAGTTYEAEEVPVGSTIARNAIQKYKDKTDLPQNIAPHALRSTTNIIFMA